MQKRTTLFSIVTVNLNNAQGLEKTIQSVIAQQYEDYEFVVVDGGSTDGSVDIIKKYQHKITDWISEQDGGVYQAMNKGVNFAQGEWINFLNSGDCYCDNQTLNTVANAIQNIQVDFVYGDSCERIEGALVAHKQSNSIEEYWKDMFLCHQTLFSRTKLMKKYPFRVANQLKVTADYDFVYRMIQDNHQFHKLSQLLTIQEVSGISSDTLACLKGIYYVNRVNCKGLSLGRHYFYIKQLIMYFTQNNLILALLIRSKQNIKHIYRFLFQ